MGDQDDTTGNDATPGDGSAASADDAPPSGNDQERQGGPSDQETPSEPDYEAQLSGVPDHFFRAHARTKGLIQRARQGGHDQGRNEVVTLLGDLDGRTRGLIEEVTKLDPDNAEAKERINRLVTERDAARTKVYQQRIQAERLLVADAVAGDLKGIMEALPEISNASESVRNALDPENFEGGANHLKDWLNAQFEHVRRAAKAEGKKEAETALKALATSESVKRRRDGLLPADLSGGGTEPAITVAEDAKPQDKIRAGILQKTKDREEAT